MWIRIRPTKNSIHVATWLLFITATITSVGQTHESLTSPALTNFWLYTPMGYSGGTPAPMLVSLHGLGQVGTNINILLMHPNDATPAYLIAQGSWPTSRPFIVVSPQLAPDGSGINQDWTAEVIDEVVEYVKTLRAINPNKIYLTGLSLGGQGGLIYGMAHPDKVAGIVDISGRTNEIITQACLLVNIPIWVFHGTEDFDIPVANSIDMVNAINACPGQGAIKPHLTLLDAGRHTIWNPIYDLTSGYQIYDWLLQFTKNDATNKPPYVNAGLDKNMLTTDGPIYLFGDLFDSDGTISSIQWTQVSGTSLSLENATTSTLKINNPIAGTFQFQLSVTDNQGLQNSDLVTVQFFNSSASLVVRNFILMNGLTNQDIDTLVNEQIINKNLLGVSQYNVRAQSTNTNSVRFRLNSNQHTRTASNFSPPSVLIINQTSGAITEWQMPVGDHVICATAYGSSMATGTEGITKCVKISVFDQPIRQYYPKPGQDLSLLNSWGTATNGTGTPPTSFIDHFQVFNVNSAAPQNGTLTIGGVESFFWVRSGGEMTVNNNFTGVINVEGNGIVNVNTSQPVTFGPLAPTTTIRFGANAVAIPAGTYGHVVVQGAGTTKTLASGTTTVTGNLLIENDVMVNGHVDNTSEINLAGDFTLEEESIFSPAVKFKLTLSSGSPHALNLSGTTVALNQLTVSTASVVLINQGIFPTTLELGSATGGGLVVQNTSELHLNQNHLSVVGHGAINSQNQTGQLGFRQGTLSILSQATVPSYVYTLDEADTVSTVTVDLTGSGAIYLQDTLFVTDSLKNLNGIVHANGFLVLVSTETKTARIARAEGTGDIMGDVQFQRAINEGRQYRYLSFPVSEVSVDDLQNFIPVTGGFSGASTGAGLSANPSLFFYQEPAGWLSYPLLDSSEEFLVGRGYSIFIREDINTTTLELSGEVHVGDFTFSIQPGSVDALVGWNLIGNPYASQLQWGSGWTRVGINPTAYVRDNAYPGGRFLVWDGADGDPEFAGLIAQGQAFWVKAFAAGASLTVHENNKASTQAFLFRTKDGPGTSTGLVVTLQQKELIDRTYFKFNNQADYTFDPHYDAVKRKNGYFNLSALSSDSVLLAIKNLPDSCHMLFGLAVDDLKPGPYSLRFDGPFFDQPEKDLLLVDTYVDSLIQISQHKDYVFSVSNDLKSFGKKRFQLRVEARLPVISIEGNMLLSNVKKGNQWLLNDQEIPGAKESTYVPTESGEYQLQITASSCTLTSAPVSYVVTGLETQKSISIFPNPARQTISLSGLHTATNYYIQNLLGQEVQKGRLPAIDGDATINLSLAPGIYVITLENETLHRAKLMVQ